jgi:hypothetical protein
MAVPDRHGAPRQRGARPWRLLAPLAAAVGVLAVVLLIAGPRIGRSPAAPGGVSHSGAAETFEAAACPATFPSTAGRPHATREGELAPADASGALLCTYNPKSNNDEGSQSLAESKQLSGSPAALMTHLNSLKEQPPPVPPGASPGTEYASDACLEMLRPSYEIVLSYPDRSPVFIAVFPNCGVMEQDGVVRYMSSLRTLLSFWA